MTGNVEGKNVLITGINGFKGSAVAHRLVREGANVIGITKQAGKINEIPRLKDCTLVNVDICDYQALCEVISYYEIDIIYHFAAYAIVRVSARDPLSTYRINVMGTVNLLEAARHVGKVERIVVASSDKAYGDHDILPYHEGLPLQPKNTYDTSKACMDMISQTYAHNYNMPVVVTRCSNVYGPGDMNLSRIIPNTIRRGLNGLPPLVYTDVSEMEREFIYIDDVVDAYIKLAEASDVVDGRAYNIGGTGPTKIYDLVDIISKVMGKDKKPVVKERDAVFKEIEKQYIDASLLMGHTGWVPEYSLVGGLKETVKWYTDFYLNGEYNCE